VLYNNAVLRGMFGPSQKEIWRQLSAELPADFVEGGFLKSDKVQATHGQWIVTLDKYVVSTGKVTVVYTRMRAPYVNPDGFRFRVYRKGVFSDLGKMFGMQDVEVGIPDFDRDFIIKGSDEGKLRQLFANPKIRELVSGQKDIDFTVKDDEGWFGPTFPEGVDELAFLVVGVIKDVERLKHLYELFGETLDELCRIGSAYQSDPGLRL
jgi:hypothetical protein